MQVYLESIKFNHDKSFKTTGAFNIRRNETQIVTLPEWRRDCCFDPGCSPVAYAISQVPCLVTIEGSFICNDESVTSISVRALSGHTLSEAKLGIPAQNILGDIPVHEVPLKKGHSSYVPFKLTNAKLREAAIGIYDVTWDWQFSLDSVSWTEFQTTRHRVYIVLAMPSLPWEPRQSNPSNIHIPWTEVLDYACSWGGGVKNDPDEAAKRVTNSVYDLGKTLVKYFKGASYANAKFDCTKFLKLLGTGIGGNQTLNCDDCATVVSTFANILGCELNQSGMGLSFQTNPILPIGASGTDWKPTTFLYHSVAWKGDCLDDDYLFDGCFQVDGDGKPALEPHLSLQPAKVQFGDFRDEAYKFCLVNSQSFCVPIPKDGLYGRWRRQIGRGYLGDRRSTNQEFLGKLKQIYKFETWPPPPQHENGAAPQGESANLFRSEIVFPNWRLYECERLQNEKFKNLYLVLFQRASLDVQELLAINLYECSDLNNPNEFLLQVLASVEQLTLTRLEGSSMGDVSFLDVGGMAVFFRNGRFVAVVRSAGRQSLSVIEFARILNRYLSTRVRTTLNQAS